MIELQRPYEKRANLSNDLVAEEAVYIFSEKSLMAKEVRFQRVIETELMYDSYYIPETRERPATSDFDLETVVNSLPELKNRLTLLTMSKTSPKYNIRVIKPNENKDLYAVFVN